MNNTIRAETKGVSFICNERGVIQRVLFDSAGFFSSREDPCGELATRYFDRESSPKVLDLFREIQQKGGSFNRELNRDEDGKSLTMLFCGVKLNHQKILLNGALLRRYLDRYVDDTMRMNNEYIYELRRLVKQSNSEEELRIDEKLYDELTRLNNELTNTQRQLSKKTVELERINDLKNRILGMTAHDLRNPLSAIQNLTKFLLDEHEESPYLNKEQKTLLYEIVNSSRLMLSIVEDLLDLSSIEAGNVRLNKQASNLNELVERVVSLQRLRIERKKMSLEVDLPETPLFCKADPDKILQVLMNLVSNAIKFSNSGTTIYIALREQSEGDVEIEVRDEGQGIPQEEFSSLFVPFADISVKATGGESSTGLGLAITKKMVDAHDGEILVDSQPGKGSTFVVRLPSGGKR